MFVGSGRALRLDLGVGAALLRNCLVVSRGHGLDVRLPAGVEGGVPGALAADHVTISATGGAIHLRSETQGDPARVHRFYFDECVFGPPLSPRANETQVPSLFSLAAPLTELRGVEWWGTSNGLSPEVSALIRGEKERQVDESRHGLPRWRTLWSEEQDVRFLTGPGGVVLAESNPGKSGIVKPSQFALHLSSKGAKWGEGGTPIGANVRRLEISLVPPKPKEPAKKPSAKGPTQPDF
jgi:hypothetical protein